MTNDEGSPNAEARRVALRHLIFVILSSFLLIFSAPSHAAANLGILGAHPKWDILENYQETITHDEFSQLIWGVYCTHGFAPDLIDINEKTARVLMNRETQKFFTLRFAKNPATAGRKPVPRLWRPAKSLPAVRSEEPLVGLEVALDPCQFGGQWAKLEERWLQ